MPPGGASANAVRTASSIDAGVAHRHDAASASRTSGRGLADRHDRAAARAQRRAQRAEVAALEAAAEDHDHPSSKLSIARARRLDVGRLRVVDEPHAADRRHRLERVLEAGEPLDRARHRRRRRRRPSGDRGRRGDVARAGARPSSRTATSGTSGTRPRGVRCTIASAVDDDAVGERALERRTARARRAACAASASAGASSALTTAQSSAAGWRRCAPSRRRTPRRRRADRGGRARS